MQICSITWSGCTREISHASGRKQRGSWKGRQDESNKLFSAPGMPGITLMVRFFLFPVPSYSRRVTEMTGEKALGEPNLTGPSFDLEKIILREYPRIRQF